MQSSSQREMKFRMQLRSNPFVFFFQNAKRWKENKILAVGAQEVAPFLEKGRDGK